MMAVWRNNPVAVIKYTLFGVIVLFCVYWASQSSPLQKFHYHSKYSRIKQAKVLAEDDQFTRWGNKEHYYIYLQVSSSDLGALLYDPPYWVNAWIISDKTNLIDSSWNEFSKSNTIKPIYDILHGSNMKYVYTKFGNPRKLMILDRSRNRLYFEKRYTNK